jgi:hypothetical protein
VIIMPRNLNTYINFQVFLNYPFDDTFIDLSNAMSFAVVAAGLIPVSAYDLTVSDRTRLEMLVDAISSCRYSAHDLSRSQGEGDHNFARMNMPIEMGMALFHALHTQRIDHRCIFFVSNLYDYRRFASDLAGLDPKAHNNEELVLLTNMYDWLRAVVSSNIFNSIATVDVQRKFQEFKTRLIDVIGSGANGQPSHAESRELMYQVCSEVGWWDWRGTRAGREEFPCVPLRYRE